MFERSGVRFTYPANWTLDADEADGKSWTATLSSPDLAFAVISLRADAEDAVQVLDEALDAVKAEFPEMDVANAMATIAGKMAVGYDLDFITVDTPIVCRLRSFESDAGPVLVLTQFSEYDREKNEPVLDAVVRSLQDVGETELPVDPA